MSKLIEYLDEQRDVERYDVPTEVSRDIASISKDLMKLSKQTGKKADGRKVLSSLKDLYDELHFVIQDFELYLF